MIIKHTLSTRDSAVGSLTNDQTISIVATSYEEIMIEPIFIKRFLSTSTIIRSIILVEMIDENNIKAIIFKKKFFYCDI
jgi:hypothetical protein